jgi:UDP-N-acetylmuramate--alanine ligase
MALNGAAAAIIAHWLGAEWREIGEALGAFAGVDRRMQNLGTRTMRHGGTVTVFDDYGHHPTECETTLKALRTRYEPRRLICVFQPHQHSRTRFLLEQFAKSFSSADVVIVPDIYFVRDSEEERQKVSSAGLVDKLRARGVAAMHIYPFGAIVEQLEVMAADGDLVVVMGAGPVWQVAHAFLGRGNAGA